MNKRLFPFGALLLAASPGMLRAVPAALPAPAVNTGAELLRVVLSLVGVIVLILVAGWVTRRAQARVRPGGRRIRIVESLAVGMKEKVLLLDVGGTQILVGASPSGLRTLHVLGTPVADEASPADIAPVRSFRDILGQWGKPQ
jgi:flagellar protein FliO/FliZ